MNKIGVEYLKRVNDGNFQHRELKLTTAVEENDKSGYAIQGVMNLAKDCLEGKYETEVIGTNFTSGGVKLDTVAPTKEANKQIQEVLTKPKNNPPVKDGKGNEVPKEDLKPVGEKKEAVKEEKKAESTKEVEAKSEEVKAETPKEEKARKPETKEVKPRGTKFSPYDKKNETHKKLVGQFLDAKFPKWREQPLIACASAASNAMLGKDFLDGNGEVLESFREEFYSFFDK